MHASARASVLNAAVNFANSCSCQSDSATWLVIEFISTIASAESNPWITARTGVASAIGSPAVRTWKYRPRRTPRLLLNGT